MSGSSSSSASSSSSSSSAAAAGRGSGDGEHALTEAEAEIYDRQIRLWGVAAQSRMRSSRVLVVGVSGLGAEVVKNIVLAGMNVVLADAEAVREDHLAAQFFITAEDVGKNVSEGGAGERGGPFSPLASLCPR